MLFREFIADTNDNTLVTMLTTVMCKSAHAHYLKHRLCEGEEGMK